MIEEGNIEDSSIYDFGNCNVCTETFEGTGNYDYDNSMKYLEKKSAVK